jgi:hypothetical protein
MRSWYPDPAAEYGSAVGTNHDEWMALNAEHASTAAFGRTGGGLRITSHTGTVAPSIRVSVSARAVCMEALPMVGVN